MKAIPLTKGKQALVDDSDYEYLMQSRWLYTQRVGTGYAECHRTVDGKRQTIRMHTLVAERCGLKRGDGVEVDHRNHNGLDNRRSNLRLATRAQNLANRGLLRNNTSGFKGVCWDRAREKWLAYIDVAGRRKHLGRFGDRGDAAGAYNEAALKYYGEFACLNPI